MVERRGPKGPQKPGGRKPASGKPAFAKTVGGRPKGSLGSFSRSFDDKPRRAPEAESYDRSFDESPRRRGEDYSFGDSDLREPRQPQRRDYVEKVEAPKATTRSGRPVRQERPRAAPPPDAPTRRELKAAASETLSTGVQTLTVTADEDDMRLDRFLSNRFPMLVFTYIQRIIRKGELRVNGKRADGKDRLEAGMSVRVPPLKFDAAPRPVSGKAAEDSKHYIQSMVIYEDKDVMVLNKPAGLAVQGGSGTKKHVDGLLAAFTDEDGQRPRLVHRLDKDTSGCLLIAKTRFAAAALSRTFRSRAARKIYWAVVQGVPKPKQGRISTFIAKEEREGESRMKVARHGDDGASHAISYYAVVDTMAQKLAWLSLKPVTGRTHQLRVHAAEIKHPIVGDPKYFNTENWELPGGMQNRLHLHARRLVVPHPRGQGTLDISAPLPPHMEQTFNLVGWDVSRFDPIVDAPEE